MPNLKVFSLGICSSADRSGLRFPLSLYPAACREEAHQVRGTKARDLGSEWFERGSRLLGFRFSLLFSFGLLATSLNAARRRSRHRG